MGAATALVYPLFSDIVWLPQVCLYSVTKATSSDGLLLIYCVG